MFSLPVVVDGVLGAAIGGGAPVEVHRHELVLVLQQRAPLQGEPLGGLRVELD